MFDKMTDRTVLTWSAMLSGYSQRGYYNSGFRGTQFPYRSVIESLYAKPTLGARIADSKVCTENKILL